MCGTCVAQSLSESESRELVPLSLSDCSGCVCPPVQQRALFALFASLSSQRTVVDAELGVSVYLPAGSLCSLEAQIAQKRRKMCAVQLLRVSVHERISAAAEDFLLQVEKGEETAEIPALRALLTERLTAAAEEIVGLFEETVAEYEDRVERSEREICRQRRLLDAVLKPEVRLHRADVEQLLRKEEVPPEQQEWSPSLDQEDPEPPHIKEEQEEVWSSQEGEQLQGLEEADITKFTFTPVPVKSEDDEEKPQSSELHQSQTEENREDCGGPGPDRNPGPVIDYKASEFSVAEIEVSCDDWEETSEAQSGLNSLESNDDPCQ
ncbi:uncharacterized protein AKAME5_002040100 [Lates japonicus]|uniref:Uncharacterized protein n=1 Tax=Lates japonicus TaxID=270547 RepID=A0AAD3N9L1_LATJO|nr:uncharacterized protein AKAME5_002040100 [Lates japonicus]